jgi:glycosyltransferase involved in cell wall biosynthesis
MLIMRTLDRARFDVHIACSAGSPGARTPGYTALAAIPDVRLFEANFGPSLSHRSAMGKARQLLGGASAVVSFAALARYIRAHDIQVLHSTDRPRDAIACAVLGKLTGATSIVHAHLKCADWMSRPLLWAMRQVDALIGVSEFVVQSLIERGYRTATTYAVLNAIDLPVWDSTLDPRPVRLELGIPAGAPVVASAGRLFRGKGQHDVVRAVAAIRSEFPDVRLLIIGRDDLQVMQTSYTQELKELAAELGVRENVMFLGQRSDMPALLAASDVFVLPSFEEPFGLVFAEALAMKRPVLALANGGAPEVVDHGKSGLLSDPDDHEALANNLATLLRDQPLRARMGEYGRQQVEARFTAERMAGDVARVYASLLSSRSDEPRAHVVDKPLAGAR